MLIREAHEDDWPLLFPIFATVVADGRTYAYPEGLSQEEARSLWMEPPPGRTVVALDGGAIVGTAKMGPNRPGQGAHVATAGFMVDPGARGRGVGRLLGEHAVEWARAAGYRAMQFNAVVETNLAAVRLWEFLGFRTLATVPGAFDHPDHGFVGLHVMYLDLTAH
ncbi:MAG: GCN5-related N-acetyltransferase [Blastococcus sp.]|nr:GCN5-related N-acetyltransferase [Blastococcus sp.]